MSNGMQKEKTGVLGTIQMNHEPMVGHSNQEDRLARKLLGDPTQKSEKAVKKKLSCKEKKRLARYAQVGENFNN